MQELLLGISVGDLAPLVQPWSWLLLAGLALPWFVGVQWRYPVFFHYFILEQHFGRFLTPAFHPEPVYYYGPVLLGLLLPWSFLLPWAWRRRRRDPDQVFLLIWAGVVVVFFSLSRGKLAPYILPALLPLALLLGRGLADLAGGGPGRAEDPGFRASLWGWAAAGGAPVFPALLFEPGPGLVAPQPAAAIFVRGGRGFHPDPDFSSAGP